MTFGRLGCFASFILVGCGPVVGEDATASGDVGTATSDGSAADPDPSVTTSGPTAGESGGVTTTVPDPSTTTPVPETTTGIDASSGPDDTSGSPFLIDPDGGLGGDPCSIWDQDCPRNEACRPWANDGGPLWNFARCSPISPTPDDVGDPCVAADSPVSGVDSCVGGAMCFGVDGDTLEGTCVEFCDSPDAPICSDPNDTCVEGNDGYIAVCLPVCDPLLQDCAAPGTCVGSWGSPDFFCMPPGTPYADGVDVMPAACGLGRVAVPPALIDACDGGEDCCTDFCDLTEPDTCAPGLTCGEFVPEGKVLGEFNVGACISPS